MESWRWQGTRVPWRSLRDCRSISKFRGRCCFKWQLHKQYSQLSRPGSCCSDYGLTPLIVPFMSCSRASEGFTRSRSSPLKELAAQEQRDESATGPPPLAEPPVLPADAVGRDLACGLGLGSLTSGHHEPKKV